MLKDILARIHSRLEAVGLAAATACSMAGLSKDAIRNMERSVDNGKDAGASTQTLIALAPVLKTTVGWLIDGAGVEDTNSPPPPPVEPGLRRVIVTAHVQAGEWAESWEWEDAEKYAVLIPDLAEYRSVRLYAAETRGPSMNKRYPERTVIVFNDVQETGEEPIPGKRYVVERRKASGDCEHTVKLLHADFGGKLWLMPESDDPRFQAPISVEEGTGDEDMVIILGRVVFSVTRE